MILLWVSVIFVLFEVTIASGELYSLFKNHVDSPLALIKKRDSSKLELAIPQKSKLQDVWDHYYYADYAHDASVDEAGPVEEFMIACSARSDVFVESNFEQKWKEKNHMRRYVGLFLLVVHQYEKEFDECRSPTKPAIEKVVTKNEVAEVQYCGQSEAEIYNVGFWEVKFVPVYKMCHSRAEGKGTLYTVHRIVSPTLLLQEAWEYYKPKPDAKKLYQSSLDKFDDIEKLLYNKQYAYQIVGTEDMPLKNWATTTQFSFNYTPITLNKVLMKDMIAVDNYIRLFSKKTNKPLTLYSGIHQNIVNKALFSKVPILYSTSTPVDSFWRIIMNDEGFATIVVIQHTAKMECDANTFICDEEPVILEDYKKSGCIYTCSVTAGVIERLGLPSDEIIQLFELPKLKINGNLVLTFPREIKTGSSSSENGKKVPAEELPEDVSISEFLGNVSFKSALENADPELASSVEVHEKTTAHDDGHGI